MATKSRSGYTRKLLAHKVRWEGGVLSALQYGISSQEISDPELAQKWGEIESLYRDLMPRVSKLERELVA